MRSHPRNRSRKSKNQKDSSISRRKNKVEKVRSDLSDKRNNNALVDRNERGPRKVGIQPLNDISNRKTSSTRQCGYSPTKPQQSHQWNPNANFEAYNNNFHVGEVHYGEFSPQQYNQPFCQPHISSFANSHERSNPFLPQPPTSLDSYEYPVVSMNNDNYNSCCLISPSGSHFVPSDTDEKRPVIKKSFRALPIVDPKTGKPLDIKSLLKARLDKRKEEKNSEPKIDKIKPIKPETVFVPNVSEEPNYQGEDEPEDRPKMEQPVLNNILVSKDNMSTKIEPLVRQESEISKEKEDYICEIGLLTDEHKEMEVVDYGEDEVRRERKQQVHEHEQQQQQLREEEEKEKEEVVVVVVDVEEVVVEEKERQLQPHPSLMEENIIMPTSENEEEIEEWERQTDDVIIQKVHDIEDAAKGSVRYDHPDMWRPDNMLGHKIYSKLFLMQFMTDWTARPLCLEEKHPTRGYNCEGELLSNDNDKFFRKDGDVKWRKSAGEMSNKKYPNKFGMMDESNKIDVGDSSGAEPNWRNSNSKSNRSAISRSNRKNKRPRSKSSKEKCVLIPTENRWERPKEASDEIEKITRFVQNIFNKISSDNYNKMVGQLKEIEIKKLSIMEAIIQVIFEKAQLESNFCSLYAKVCNDIGNNLSVEYDIEGNKDTPTRSRKVTFKRALLARCQIGFEEKKLPQKLPSTLTSREEISGFMMVQNKINSKNMGMIKFIGELFINGMLGENIIHRCLSSLLGDWNSNEPMDEVSLLNLEHFIHLMSTAGSKIDHSKGAKVMRGYFSALDHLITRPAIPSKLKFRVMDLRDLRKNRWVNPKKK